jgi:ABC-type branched-subunit amino acid transport system substrate-binding protein
MHSRIVATCAVMALLAVACGNANTSKATDTTLAPNTGPATTASPAELQRNVHVDAPGVSDTEIKVAAISTNSNNPIGSNAPVADGVKAYFAMVNAGGGIYGRKLVLTADHDDQLGSNRQTVQASLSQDKAFATFIATIFFSGADLLARANQPVFMWNINSEFAGHPTFFANDSALCFTCAGHIGPWLAKELKVTKIGLLAYGGAPQSADCATGVKASFAKYGGAAKVVFDDESIGFAQPLGPQVTKMKQKGVQFVLTCVDLQEAFTLAQEMKKQGLNASQQLPEGYDQNFIAKNGALLDGSIVIPQFLAFEQTPQIPEIKDLFKWADKIGVQVSELTAVGWQIASEFYTGLRGAGPEFSQAKVVAYLNTLTHYTDNGFLQPLDWTTGHIDPIKHPEARAKQECANFVKIENGKFVPQFGQPGKPWVCFKTNDPTVDNPVNKSFAPS